VSDPTPGVTVRVVAPSHQAAFVAAAQASEELHGRWVSTPTTPEAFERYLTRFDGDRAYGFVLETRGPAGELVGYVNITQVEKEHYRRGVLGYAIFAGHERRGYMTEGLRQVIALAFGEMGLHRLEAEIQPGNKASRRLVKKLAFRRESFSPALVFIDDAWKDHERWVIIAGGDGANGRRRPWQVRRRPRRFVALGQRLRRTAASAEPED
jgi:ribosomal-protein-alanine N-acetyltransferase